MHRLFTAIKILPESKLVKVMEDFSEKLNDEKIKWVNKNNIHITLKFFGQTPEKQIPNISDVLEKASQKSSSFHLTLKSCGTFGSPRFPRVIWLGLENNNDLINLYDNINKNLTTIGYEPEKRAFSPHLTIGRVKHIKNLYIIDELISKYSDEVFMSQYVDEFCLYESVLKKEGPQYTVLKTFKLK